MLSIQKLPLRRIVFLLWLAVLTAASATCPADAQAVPPTESGRKKTPTPVPAAKNDSFSALMLSDIHFDPFHDPATLQQLIDAPVSGWKAVLSVEPSPGQKQAFDALQQKCGARGVDTPYSLLASSLEAVKSLRPKPEFMMVSGDLIAHSFPCRFKTLLPGATQGEYQAFVLKTLSFVAQELRDSIPEKPVYVALGNNDSGCDDYRLDAGSEFLAEASKAISKGLPEAQRQNTIHQFAEGGYYSLAMGAPMRDTRLIVINDVFLSPSYTTCGGAPQAAAGNAEMAWFKKQLEDARLAHERVWVMGHIPPGVDVYSTMRKMLNICGMAKPETFLLTDKMANLMVEYADVIQLGIFAHTHMDEMQLLKSADSGAPVSSRQGVAIKRVPSISPVNGNQPSFTLARVNATTAMLQDFEVIEASNQSGVGAAWSREYSYSETYGETEYSPASVTKLVAGFERDRDAHGKLTQAYLRDYLVGDRSAQLAPFWSIYACGLENWTDKAFANCVCSAGSSNTTGESAK